MLNYTECHECVLGSHGVSGCASFGVCVIEPEIRS